MVSDDLNIPPKDITILYFKGRPEPTKEKFTIKFSDSLSVQISMNVELLPYNPFFNMKTVKFQKVHLGEDEKSYVRICNELPDPLYLSWDEKFAGEISHCYINFFQQKQVSQKNTKKAQPKRNPLQTLTSSSW